MPKWFWLVFMGVMLVVGIVRSVLFTKRKDKDKDTEDNKKNTDDIEQDEPLFISDDEDDL